MGLMTTNESQARELRDESPTTPGSGSLNLLKILYLANIQHKEYEDDKNESDLYLEYREAVGRLDNNVRFEEYHNEYHDEYDKAQILQNRGGLAEEVERLRAKCVEKDVSLTGKLQTPQLYVYCLII
jgi:hypothetical protein